MILVKKRLLISLLIAVLQGCATGPGFPRVTSADHVSSPHEALALPDFPVYGEIVWGGQILHLANLPGKTRVEVLAYPLDDNQRPEIEDPSQGRFIIEKAGYLESTDFSDYRLVTVHGRLRRLMDGKVGEVDYRYPVIEAEKIYLWPLDRGGWLGNRIRFGIGINISN